MHEETDRRYARYFSYLNLFAAFMLVLVLGSNFLGDVRRLGRRRPLFVSADRLLVSRRSRASDAGKKAFIVNRIGDFGIHPRRAAASSSASASLDFQDVARSGVRR